MVGFPFATSQMRAMFKVGCEKELSPENSRDGMFWGSFGSETTSSSHTFEACSSLARNRALSRNFCALSHCSFDLVVEKLSASLCAFFCDLQSHKPFGGLHLSDGGKYQFDHRHLPPPRGVPRGGWRGPPPPSQFPGEFARDQKRF
jgi:hypothetical protein